MNGAPVLAVTGMQIEAQTVAGPQIAVFAGGGDGRQLARDLHDAAGRDASAIISVGIAGGLAPGLKPGTCLVGRGVIDASGAYFESDRRWANRLAMILGAPTVDIAGVDAPVTDPAQKRALHVETGAVAVDMESHIAARVARAHDLPFACLRVVADPAERRLPPAVLVGMRRDGTLALGAVICSILRQPGQLPSLYRTALDARTAFAALLGCRKVIAGALGFHLAEPLFDLADEDVIGGSLAI